MAIIASRREFLKSAAIGVAAMTALPAWLRAAVTTGPARRPNIIVILADDLGWGDLSCYPQEASRPGAVHATPMLDKLAAGGVRCMQAYATSPICAPSRAGLLAGCNQQRLGYYAFEDALVGIPRDRVMLAELLKKTGYATACIGKWHVSFGADNGPLSRGFDRFYGFLGGQHDYYDPRNGEPTLDVAHALNAPVLDQDRPVEHINYLTDDLTRRAIDFIGEQARNDTPFFLYLPYNAPHPPLQATAADAALYLKGGKLTSRDLVRAMIDALDRNVGCLLDELKRLGIDENTLVIFTSDNGGQDDGPGRPQGFAQYNGGLRPRKGFLYEGGIRIPMIVRFPGRTPQGLVYQQPVSHLDIYAMAATAAGIQPAQSIDGVDPLPYFAGAKTGSPHDALYWGFKREENRWAVRNGKWKLICEHPGPGAEREKPNECGVALYDLDADPHETRDLSADHPQVVAELTKLKDDFYRQARPSLATPALLQAARQRAAAIKADPALRADRHDGYPGHWK